MKIGIVYEDFHSEVVEFILEILQFELDTNIVIYNDKDKYDNIDIYQQKYNRIQRRSLGYFIKDLNNEVCDKYIVISYTNLVNLGILSEFKERLIFIGHDSNQVEQLKSHRMNHIVLSKLLSNKLDEQWKFMLPICKNSKIENNYSDLKSVETEEQFKKRNTFIKENNLKTMVMVGHFLINNKDLELIEKMLMTKKVFIFIFAPALTKEIQETMKAYGKYILCGVGFSTKTIEKIIEDYKINHLLFAPPKDSNFFKTQWSGSIAFGINRNMTVIMPDELADNYMLKDCVITYKEPSDISEKYIDSLIKKDTSKVRSRIYKRNVMVMELLLTNKYKEYNYKNGYLCKDTNEIGLDNTEQLMENLNDNTNVYMISPKTSKMGIDIVQKKEKCKVLLFNKELSKCLEYKNTVILYNYEDKIKIFNEELKGQITLDEFDIKVDTVIKEGNDINEIISSKKTMEKYKPKIVLIKKDNDQEENRPIEMEGYYWKSKDLVNTNLDKFQITEWINITKR